MPNNTEMISDLYLSDLFEIHAWKNSYLPFIFHTDTVENFSSGHGNWHESLEILMVLEGSGSILCDSRKYDLSVGDIIVINSNEVHRLYSENRLIFHCFIIGVSFCIENGLDFTKLKFKTKINDSRAAELYNRAITEIEAARSDDADNFSIPAARANALALLVYLSQNFSEDFGHGKENDLSDIIRTGLDYINQNFLEKLTLEDIARKAGISKYHFLREFKRYTGYTVVTYINILRCEYAKRLLHNTSFSVGKIARECGYDNPSYFTKTFKKYNGCLPSRY